MWYVMWPQSHASTLLNKKKKKKKRKVKRKEILKQRKMLMFKCTITVGMNNSERVIAQANNHITNINRLLKGVKFKISVDYIQSGNKGIVITTNKVVASSNLNIVEIYKRVEWCWLKWCYEPETSTIQVIPKNFKYSILSRRY